MSDAAQQVPQKRVRPRVALIFTTALLGVFYFIYLVSVISLMIAMRAKGHDLAMTLTQELPQSDFARFWYVGQRLLMRDAAALGFHLAPSAWFVRSFPLDILSSAAPPAKMWLYPPPMGLLAMPFALLPLAPAFWVWRGVSVVVAALLLRRAGLGWGVIVAGLASTAALHDLVGGQNGTLVGGLLVSALLLAETRPGLAGALAGALVVKPQMALVFPMIVLRSGSAKLLAVGALTALALALLSWLAEGTQAWVWFLIVGRPAATLVAEQPFSVFFPAAGITVFSMARGLGAGLHAAWAWQAVSSVAALGLVWVAWRPGTMASQPRMAFTCALGVLAMPYGFAYDLVAFSLGMTALYPRASGWERLMPGLLWLMGGYTITLANYTGLVLFPVFAVLGAALAWRLRASPAAQ
jgi:hypothetical protein